MPCVYSQCGYSAPNFQSRPYVVPFSTIEMVPFQAHPYVLVQPARGFLPSEWTRPYTEVERAVGCRPLTSGWDARSLNPAVFLGHRQTRRPSPTGYGGYPPWMHRRHFNAVSPRIRVEEVTLNDLLEYAAERDAEFSEWLAQLDVLDRKPSNGTRPESSHAPGPSDRQPKPQPQSGEKDVGRSKGKEPMFPRPSEPSRTQPESQLEKEHAGPLKAQDGQDIRVMAKEQEPSPMVDESVQIRRQSLSATVESAPPSAPGSPRLSPAQLASPLFSTHRKSDPSEPLIVRYASSEEGEADGQSVEFQPSSPESAVLVDSHSADSAVESTPDLPESESVATEQPDEDMGEEVRGWLFQSS